jgi:flavin-dependent dehydrogenase
MRARQNKEARPQINKPGPMRVAVVGGGPAGAFFSYILLSLARVKGRDVEVSIFEPKKFEKKGAPNCNYCQGVVSAGLVRAMEDLGLKLPDYVIQAKIQSYQLVTLGRSLRLWAPQHQDIFTVYRGQGPHSEKAGSISFDQFLLECAMSSGARKISAWIEKVEVKESAADPVTLTDNKNKSYSADIVIGAFGVNSTISAEFENLGFGYRRPETSSALQAEYKIDEEFIRLRLGQEIKVFALGLYPIRFGVITPKHGYITVSLIGRRLGSEHLERFMGHPQVLKFLPADLKFNAGSCSCAPRFPVKHGKELAGPHYMIIGDAGASRYYKNGIESALFSAELAAGVLVENGPEQAELLRRHYSSRVQSRYRLDNFLGRILFRIHDLINYLPAFTRAHLSIVGDESSAAGYSRNRLRWILWNMFTGDAPYNKIFFHCLNPLLLGRVFFSTAAELIGLGYKPKTSLGD